MKKTVNKKVRGSAIIYDDDSFEFAPYQEGKPQQEPLSHTPGAKLYRTTSEHNPKLVAHLTADHDDPDAVSTLYGQLERLTRGMQPDIKKPDRRRGRVLRNAEIGQLGMAICHEQNIVRLYIAMPQP